MWFPSHVYVGLIPNSSGQLAELIVYIIPLGEIGIVTKSYCWGVRYEQYVWHFDGLVHDCSISSAFAVEIM